MASREGPGPAQWDTQSRPAASQQHQGHLGTKSAPGCAQVTWSTVRLSEFFSHHHAAHSDEPLSTGAFLFPWEIRWTQQLHAFPVLSPCRLLHFFSQQDLAVSPIPPSPAWRVKVSPHPSPPLRTALPAALVLQVCQPPIRSPCSRLSTRHSRHGTRLLAPSVVSC